MPDDVTPDAAPAESSPASPTGTTAAPSSAETQNTVQPPAEAQVPFHQHPRFQELIQQHRTARQENQRLAQTIQQLTQRLEVFERQGTNGQPLTPEQSQQYREAGDALWRIVQAHPDLKWLADLKGLLPQLQQTAQVVPHLTEANKRGLINSGRQEIAKLAADAKLPAEEKFLRRLEGAVVDVVLSSEEGRQRFSQGDLTVLKDAFNEVQRDLIGALRQTATAPIQDAKTRTRNLPPAPRGGLPGTPAPQKSADPRVLEEQMHTRAREKLRELLTG